MTAPARKVTPLVAAFLLLSGVLPAAEPAPDAQALLMSALAQPAIPYRGRVTLTRWHGTAARSEEANVYFRPPNAYRMEFLTPGGDVERVVLSNGARREVQLLKRGAVIRSDETFAPASYLNDDQQRALLLLNYRVSVAGTEKVLSRTAWVLDLSPIEAGKPKQRMLIDRDSHVVLDVRRVGAGAGATTTFTRFEPNVSLPDTLFASLSPLKTVREEGSSSLQATGWPASLPGGFSLLSNEAFETNGQTVRQYRYFDGLTLLSVFVTSVPVQGPADANPAQDLLAPRTEEAVRQWRSGGLFYTAIGDVPSPLLAQIQQKLD